MKILVINCGSSSLKYQLIDMTDESVICSGICDRIGNSEASSITYKAGDKKYKIETPFPTHTEAFLKLVEMMTSGESAVIADKSEIDAPKDTVTLGSIVRVLDLEVNEEDEYEIVGSQEANPKQGRISDDSPAGRALRGHRAGDTVSVPAPAGEVRLQILSVENK